MPSPRVTATNLAAHAHLQCDLYLHQSYHGVNSSSIADVSHIRGAGHREPPAAILLATFAPGNDWESALFMHLDQHGLLLTNQGPPLSGADIASVIELDDRSHFFVAGIEFWPPRQKLLEKYEKRGVDAEDVPRFGLAKPDLVEIWREGNRRYVWRIIDAKASKEVKVCSIPPPWDHLTYNSASDTLNVKYLKFSTDFTSSANLFLLPLPHVHAPFFLHSCANCGNLAPLRSSFPKWFLHGISISHDTPPDSYSSPRIPAYGPPLHASPRYPV